MRFATDHSGKSFGRLKALKYVGAAGKNKSAWLCECDCGNITIVRTDRLVSGKTKSCGGCNATGAYAIGEPKTGLLRASLDGFNPEFIVKHHDPATIEKLVNRVRDLVEEIQ